MPTLANIDPSGKQDAPYGVVSFDSFDGTVTQINHDSDSGIFEGIFTFTTANFIKLRNYIRTRRTQDWTLANTFGVAYPFGPRSDASYPFTAKLIDWEDMGFYGLGYHKARLKFAEAV
jgi:hypothetical protein